MISMGLADINMASLETNLGISKERLKELAEIVVRHKDDSLTDFLDMLTHEREWDGLAPLERMYLAFKVGYAIGTFHGDKIRAMQPEEEEPNETVPTIIIFRGMPE